MFILEQHLNMGVYQLMGMLKHGGISNEWLVAEPAIIDAISKLTSGGNYSNH
jgi:hypothetical protein